MVLMGEVALPLAAVREQVQASLDLIVHVARRPGGGRRIVAVSEVVDTGADAIATGAPVRTRPLADARALYALPERPARAVDAPAPDPAWLTASGSTA
jgi:hypothetical protein